MADNNENSSQQIAGGQNAQAAKPTTGPVSPEVQHRIDVQAKVDAAYKGALLTDDIAQINGPFNDNITPESLAKMQEIKYSDHHLVHIDRKNLTPEAAANPLFNEKDAAGNYLPIYVITNLGNDKSGATIIKMSNGERVIFANEGSHQWTESYVKTEFMKSDADITGTYSSLTDFLAAGPSNADNKPASQYTPEQKKRIQSVVDSTAQSAKNNGVAAYQLMVANNLNSPAAALTSIEGHHYIVLDTDAVDFITASDSNADLFKGVMGHEVDHIANGDTTVASIINNKSFPKQRREEILADLGGAGPLGSHNAEAFAKYFRKDLQDSVSEYKKLYPTDSGSSENVSDQELINASLSDAKGDLGHPAKWDRMVALQDEAKVMKAYEASHKVKTLADRKIESDFVIKQVMQDMRGKWEMPIDETTPNATLPTPKSSSRSPQKGHTPS